MAFDFSQLREKFDSVLAIVGDDLKTIKTGRAKPALVEDVLVEAYGTQMPLKELASISAPDPHMILVSPWDQGLVNEIEKALSTGKNQFNPTVDGKVIRIVIPPLTGERREEYIKMVHQRIESGKQMIRAQRTETKKEIEEQEGTGGISEDDIKRDLEELDRITAEYNRKLEEMGKAKEEELRKI